MRPLDFYELGRQMVGSAQTEAEQRTAVNRLYYGLHHEACGRYFQREPAPQPLNRNSRHSDIQSRFRSGFNTDGMRVGELLGQLSRLRNVADYELHSEVNVPRDRSIKSAEQLMRMSITVSEGLKTALDSYSPSETPDGLEYPVVYSRTVEADNPSGPFSDALRRATQRPRRRRRPPGDPPRTGSP